MSVVGAGAVGSAVAYALSNQQIPSELALFDIDAAKVAAEAADLAHGAGLQAIPRVEGSDDPAVTTGSEVIVVSAGANRRPGQSRLELAGVNASVARSVVRDLLTHSPDAVIVVVTNPCDVLATVIWRELQLPAGRVLSSGTLLDSARLRSVLAKRLQVSAASIDAWVIGEHGDTQFPLWSSASVGGVPVSQWPDRSGLVLGETERENIAAQVRDAGRAVIEGKGVTNLGIGQSVARIVRAIVLDEQLVLPVGVVLEDYLGHSGVAVSVPSVVGHGGVVHQPVWPMTETEVARLSHSVQAVDEVVTGLL